LLKTTVIALTEDKCCGRSKRCNDKMIRAA